MIGQHTSQAEQDALRDEREPHARGLRRVLPFLSKSMTTPIKPEPFKRDISALVRRFADREAKDRETAKVVRSHLMAMGPRIGQALDLLRVDNPNLGSVRAYLEIGQRDLEAALKACPTL